MTDEQNPDEENQPSPWAPPTAGEQPQGPPAGVPAEPVAPTPAPTPAAAPAPEAPEPNAAVPMPTQYLALGGGFPPPPPKPSRGTPGWAWPEASRT